MKQLYYIVIFFFLSVALAATEMQEILSQDFYSLMFIDDLSQFSIQDRTFFNKCKMQYDQYKQLLLQPSYNNRIPKIIHFIWLGPKNFPKESIKNIRSWVHNHPDWEMHFWTDRPRPPPCSSMQVKYVQDFTFFYLADDYQNAKNWGEKSDILRYEILYRFGGVYVDHDTICKKSLDILHDAYDFYVCASAPHAPIEGYSTAVIITPIGAQKQHPIIQEAIYITKMMRKKAYEQFPEKTKYDERFRIMRSAYIALTMALDKRLLDEERINIVFPPVFFYGDPRYDPLFIEQYCAGTWINHDEDTQVMKEMRKAFSNLQLYVKKIEYLQIVAVFLLGFVALRMGK